MSESGGKKDVLRINIDTEVRDFVPTRVGELHRHVLPQLAAAEAILAGSPHVSAGVRDSAHKHFVAIVKRLEAYYGFTFEYTEA
jgi:hypothetical protein